MYAKERISIKSASSLVIYEAVIAELVAHVQVLQFDVLTPTLLNHWCVVPRVT